ncbi:unnamed protein product [Timema podura]|uniref:Peptidase S1 domain-containing protein n=1 Tax=Timema podura TaxID=61482 RepID=A0ABN7P1D7_TIMPD|nr:unnamed protein product [Timema podura]
MAAKRVRGNSRRHVSAEARLSCKLLEASTDYIVVAGKTDVSQLKKEGDLEHQIRDVIAIIPHSDFRKALFAHDIALLLVSHPIKQAPNIKYVKVPKHLSQDDSPDVRGPCTAIGWGKLNFSSVDLKYLTCVRRKLSLMYQN